MEGYEGDDRINVKSTNKVYAFCQVDEQINQEVCNDTKIGESRWSSFPDMKSSLYGFKGFGHTYCAQFNNDDLCDGLCLMASELKKVVKRKNNLDFSPWLCSLTNSTF